LYALPRYATHKKPAAGSGPTAGGLSTLLNESRNFEGGGEFRRPGLARTPCLLIDRSRPGLKRHVPSLAETGPLFKCGVLGVVRAGSGRRRRAGSALHPPPSRPCRRCKSPAQDLADRWPNRKALARSDWHGREQGNGGTRGAAEAIDGPEQLLSRPASPSAFSRVNHLQEAFALARSRASRRRSRRSRRLLARSAGCRRGGTSVATTIAAIVSTGAWLGSDSAGRASMNSSTARPLDVIFHPPLARSTGP
jgi:hypothetical protein